jgi:2-methylisocitrate lyase-like PEP mutase family enzyme
MPDEKLKEHPMTPGAYDTLTARLVEQAGFEVVYLTGGGYSRANGYPDLGLLTLSENVRFIGLTVEAVAIPVIADADTGYGNAINVIRTVREYEKSGVAAFHIEDQVSPKKCGHYPAGPRFGHHRPLGRAGHRGPASLDRPRQRLS